MQQAVVAFFVGPILHSVILLWSSSTFGHILRSGFLRSVVYDYVYVYVYVFDVALFDVASRHLERGIS